MRRRHVWLAAAFIALIVLAPPARAEVGVVFDVETMNALLPALIMNEVQVPVPPATTLRVRLEDVRVLGFDPADGPEGSILTSLRLTVPELGLSLPLQPRLSLDVARGGPESQIELRFSRLPLRVPLAGSFDVATFLPPLRFPAENVWEVTGGQGVANVRSRLTDIRVGQRDVHFVFEVTALNP